MVDRSGTRFAYPAVALKYGAHKHVYAAVAGTARYYPALAGFGKAIVIRTSGGAEVLYAGFAAPKGILAKRGSMRVKAGEVVAFSGASSLRFEYAPSGGVRNAGTQVNPCGTGASNGASGSIGVMPTSVPIEVRFHSLTLDGVAVSPGPYPAASPDVLTPQTLTAASTAVAHTIAASVYEPGDSFGSYYVVLCGNVVFATGRHARYAGPFTFADDGTSASPSPLPNLVFFRDPGDQGASLIEPLPQPWGKACPAPPPAYVYNDNFAAPVFYWVGQSKFLYYWSINGQSGDNVILSSSAASIVAVSPASPSPLPVFATEPPAWPPPSPRAEVVSTGVGTATIDQWDTSCGCYDSPNPIVVTVVPTPTPAPVPSPLPND